MSEENAWCPECHMFIDRSDLHIDCSRDALVHVHHEVIHQSFEKGVLRTRKKLIDVLLVKKEIEE